VKRSDRGRHGIAAILFVVLGMAPTVGDIGSCGQSPDDLDPTTFFTIKAHTDCSRCGECGITSKLCDRACGTDPLPTSFPSGCHPLVHDGEVCLRTLLAASCDDYASFVNDAAPTAPSECQFCPLP
jgi:hypothetical protein